MKKIIESLNMTIYQFSKHYNIPYSTVLQWYKGERTPPTYVVTLFKEKIERDKKGVQLEIQTEIKK